MEREIIKVIAARRTKIIGGKDGLNCAEKFYLRTARFRFPSPREGEKLLGYDIITSCT